MTTAPRTPAAQRTTAATVATVDGDPGLPVGLLAEPDGGTALPAPRALLLDFGGVVVTTTARVSWARDLAEVICARAVALGAELDPGMVEGSLRAGRTALSLWKNAASRRLQPPPAA